MDSPRIDDDYYTAKLKVRWRAWMRIEQLAQDARREPHEHAAFLLEQLADRTVARRKPVEPVERVA
jgi:hypothetical protein